MRKLTRKNLDELAKVMPVISEVEQRMFVGGNSGEIPGGMPNGPDAECYTWEQYWSMVSSGTWTGGFVDGYGYIMPEITITADGTITSSFSGLSMGFIPIEGVGVTGNFAYKGSYLIENGYMSVGCSIYSHVGNDITVVGSIMVYVEGTEVLRQSLTTSPSMIYESGSIPVGCTTFNLQQYTGYVEVKIELSYLKDFGTNYDGTNTTKTIYSSYR